MRVLSKDELPSQQQLIEVHGALDACIGKRPEQCQFAGANQRHYMRGYRELRAVIAGEPCINCGVKVSPNRKWCLACCEPAKEFNWP